MAMLVRQSSVAAFLAFAENETYLAGIGHRVAALEDARLLPLEEMSLPGHARGGGAIVRATATEHLSLPCHRNVIDRFRSGEPLIDAINQSGRN
ncbi:hypothetical protein [Novosphingobium sp. NBM11]|uniref:hypothetical protein n=1 Tax=Novosphingobium sp. NBM11 TaxID=2596914 RepID=UPI0019D64AC2|nr:hypothetical protein [Novosphingobium sp. NBM11]